MLTMAEIRQDVSIATSGLGTQIAGSRLEASDQGVHAGEQHDSPQSNQIDDQLTEVDQDIPCKKSESSEPMDDQQSPHNDWTPQGDRLAIDDSPGSNGDIENEADLLDEIYSNLTTTTTSAPSHFDNQPENNEHIWTLPDDKELCTLDEIRRGQVINKVAPNECPVPGCGKKINEMKTDPSPGTIASGLRTHVVFVHYANVYKRVVKKRKISLASKRRAQPLIKKQLITNQQMITNSDHELDPEPENYSMSNFMPAGLNLIQKGTSPQKKSSLLKRAKRTSTYKPNHPTSLQTLMQATGASLTISGIPQPENQKNITKNNEDESAASTNNFNQQTSSLFSLLAGLSQQNLVPQPQPSVSKTIKTVHGTNSINITQCSRNDNPTINDVGPINSSLLSLLNENISASSLKSQSARNLPDSHYSRGDSNRQDDTPANFQSKIGSSEAFNYNNFVSLMNNPTGEAQLMNYDNSLPLNTFVELIAIRTGCNIGQAGVAEAKKIIEKFTMSLICNSQTIADHYVAPFSTEVIQQKTEIGPSDVMLAYKMMQKSNTQP